MGFTRTDIRACALCGQGVGGAGPVFYRARIEQLAVDVAAVQRESGLEALMGGNATIASALSPERDFAKTFRQAEVLLCGACGLEPHPLALLLDEAETDSEEDAQ